MLFGHQKHDVKPPAEEPVAAPQPVTQITPTLNPLAVDPTTGVSLPTLPDDPQTGQDTPTDQQPEQPATGSAPTNDTPADSVLQPLDLPPLPTPPTAQSTPAPIETAPPMPNALDAPLPEPPVPAAPAEPVPSVQAEPEPITETPTPELSLPEPLPEPPAPVEAPVVEPTMPFETIEQPAPAPESPAEPALADQPVATGAIPALDDLLALKQQALAELTPLVDQLEQTPEERFRTKMMMIQSTDDQTLIKDAYEAAQSITDEKVRAQALLDVVNEINYFTAQQPAQQ